MGAGKRKHRAVGTDLQSQNECQRGVVWQGEEVEPCCRIHWCMANGNSKCNVIVSNLLYFLTDFFKRKIGVKNLGPLKRSCLQRGSSGCDKYKELVGEVHFLFPIRPFHPRWLLVGSLSPSRAHGGGEAQSSRDYRKIIGRRAGQGWKQG